MLSRLNAQATIVCLLKFIPTISFIDCSWPVTMELQVSCKNLRYLPQCATKVVPQLL